MLLQLHQVDLSGTAVTGAGLLALALAAPGLQHLTVDGCSALGLQDLAGMLHARAALQQLLQQHQPAGGSTSAPASAAAPEPGVVPWLTLSAAGLQSGTGAGDAEEEAGPAALAGHDHDGGSDGDGDGVGGTGQGKSGWWCHRASVQQLAALHGVPSTSLAQLLARAQKQAAAVDSAAALVPLLGGSLQHLCLARAGSVSDELLARLGDTCRGLAHLDVSGVCLPCCVHVCGAHVCYCLTCFRAQASMAAALLPLVWCWRWPEARQLQRVASAQLVRGSLYERAAALGTVPHMPLPHTMLCTAQAA